MLRDALSRYTSFVGSAATFPSKGKAHCRVLFCRQRFCDCVRAYPFFFLRRKKNSEKERPLRGLRREVRFIMSPPEKRRHNELNAAPPLRPPGERASRERQPTEMLYTAEKVSVFGKNLFAREPRGTTRLSLPLEGKVPEGRMRCSAPARLCRQMSHFASLTEIL